MRQQYNLKIDAYSHIVPEKYKKILSQISPEQHDTKVAPCPSLYDLGRRFQIMDKYEPIRQVLTLAWPPIEEFAESKQAAELAQIANDGMAELVSKYPDRFVAAIGILPMNNVDAALKEADRAIKDLRLKGVYIYTPIQGKPLDLPEFMPLFEKMSQYDLPIFIHPMRWKPDYIDEKTSKYMINSILGWPFETAAAMIRLVCSGIMEKYPGLKIVTHHCGGMVPYLAERIRASLEGMDSRGQLNLKKDGIDYFKMFYNDTALYGNPKALECANAFFGVDHLLFGVDFPLGDSEDGHRNYRQTINAIEQMDITADDKKKIYENNARKLMRLPI